MISKSLFLFICCHQALSTPLFLYNAPQALTSLISSASSASSSSEPVSNISNLRKSKAAKLQENEDDFFKEAFDNQVDETVDQTQPPSLVQTKLNKVFQKFRILTALANPQNPSTNDDDFQKEQDDFDKEYNKDFSSEDLVEGYFYNKPEKVTKSAKQEALSGFSPANIGVFVMELIGSLVGLAYGAAAQLNFQGTSTTPSST